jgi:hypothetical protein
MPPLIRFLIINAAMGFGLGSIVGCAFIDAAYGIALLAAQPLAAVMLIWGFGASFAMGAIGSALALDSER